jgi:subtilase family serine protease
MVKLLLATVSFALLFLSVSYAAVQDRISGSLTSGQNVTLRGNVHRRALPQFDQGPVDPAMRMGTLTLSTLPTAAQQRAITQLLAEQQDRKSQNYHKWITPEQYADRFGMSQNDVQRISSWLKAQGFTGIHPARGRNWISFTGTAAQVQRAFATEIRRFNVNGELHYANTTAPSIPAALRGIVAGIRGLHDFQARPMGVHRRVTPRPDYNSTNFGPLVAPGDIAAIYDIKALYDNGIDGSGQKIAVMGQTDIYLADINSFRTGFGLASISCTTSSTDVITACSDPYFSYKLYGGDPGLSKNGDISEADLDVEWAGAVARGAQIIYVNSSNTFTSYYNAIDDNLAPVISLSYGLCELDDQPFLAGDEVELQKGTAEGITIVNSTGDSGAAECDFGGSQGTLTSDNLATLGLAVSYPASSSFVTGVGGTAIPLANLGSPFWSATNAIDGASTTSYIPEQVWNDDAEIAEFCAQNPSNTFCTQGGSTAVNGWVPITSALTAQNDIAISSTGGGPSNCSVANTSNPPACISGFTKPTWQTVTVTGQGNVRLSPDVSFLATPNFPGYIFCTQLSELGLSGTGSSCAGGISGSVENDASIIGGTSVSAPVFAGIVSLLNQYLASADGLGNVNPMLYTLAKTSSNGAFNPVTTGDNTVYCSGGLPTTQPSSYRCPGATGTTGVIGFQASNADATTGYNLVAGLGSVDVNNLALAWAGSLAPGFSITPTASSYQVTQGSSINATVTVSMSGGFTGPVTFTCTDPAPESTCTAPSDISTTSNVSFNITTTPPTVAQNSFRQRTQVFYALFLPGLFGVIFAATPRRSLRGMRFLGLITILGFSTLWLASCGGGNGAAKSSGTTKGTYTISVTAASGSTSLPATFQLVVQ